MYNWFSLLYSRNYHNIVNQLYFNKTIKKGEKGKKKWKRINNNQDYINTKKIIIEYYGQLYAHKVDSLEVDKFLETHSQPTVSQEETDNLYRLIMRSEIESVI